MVLKQVYSYNSETHLKSYNFGSNFIIFFELLLHKINFFREKREAYGLCQVIF